MPPVPPGHPFPCCVEAPDGLLARARYGVAMLLLGLGLEPRWVEDDGLTEGGLYYGPNPERAPTASVALRLGPASLNLLGGTDPLDPAAVSALDWEGRLWPVLAAPGQRFDQFDLDADVVASTSAWLSGRLEQAVTARDIHARLPAAETPTALLAAARPDLADPTHFPPVEAYRAWLGAALEAAGRPAPGRTWAGRPWAVVPTIDVDLVRTWRPSALLGRDPRRERLAGLVALLAERRISATTFLMMGATAAYDVRYRPTHPTLAPVWAAAQAGQMELGLHPSYFAHDHPGHLAAERDRLTAAARQQGATAAPTVRTHFLRWTEPGTPHTLMEAGFRLDSSLGFSTRAGFRRGTSTPYQLFSLEADRPLDLWTVPLAAMDTALLVHSDGQEAERALDRVLEGARESGGCAVLLWHNEPLSGPHLALLAHALDRATAEGAHVAGLTAAVSGWQAG